MARFGGMTALRAALGGVGGYFEGVGQQREMARLEEEQKRALARQQAMDLIALQDKGYMAPEQQAQAKRTGGAAVLRAALTGARDQGAIDTGLSAAAPQQRITFGGQEFTRESPMAKAAREASRATYLQQQEDARKTAATTEERARKQAILSKALAKGATDADKAVAISEGLATPDQLGILSASQRDVSARGWADINLRRQAAQAAAAGTGGTGGAPKKATDKLSLQATLPNVIAYSEAFAKMTPEQIRKMSPGKMDFRSTAKAKDDLTGLAMRYGQGAIKSARLSPAEERYISMANAVADAVSRASDIGVQSNFDIKRFRSQVTPLAGDSPDEMEAKLRIVQGWANWLIAHRNTIEQYDAAYEAGKPLPTISLQGPTELDGVSKEEATGSTATPRGVSPVRTQVQPMQSSPDESKKTRRADRWDQIKAQNPRMTDDQITAQVMREIP